MKRFIVIEKMNYEIPTIVTDEDGNVKIFNEIYLAEEEMEDCQDGQIVEI